MTLFLSILGGVCLSFALGIIFIIIVSAFCGTGTISVTMNEKRWERRWDSYKRYEEDE